MVNRSGEPVRGGQGPSGGLVHGAGHESSWPPAGELAEHDGLFDHGGEQRHGVGGGFSVWGLLRHKWLMLGVFGLTAAVSIPLIWWLVEVEYRATALVRVAPRAPMLVFPTESNSTAPLYRNYLNSQVSTIRTVKVLQRVLDQKEVRETRWYREEGKRFLNDPLPALDRLFGSLVVQPRQDTELIEVSMTAQKGGEAKLIADTVVGEYDRLMKERAREGYLSIIEKVRQKYDTLEKEIKGLQDVKFALAQDSGLMDSEALRSQLSTRVYGLESQYRDAKRELAFLMARLERSQKEASESRPAAEASTGGEAEEESTRPYAGDAEWRALAKAAKNARYELELARQRYGESHPVVKHGLAGVEHADRLVRDREGQLEEQWNLQDRATTTGPAAEVVAARPRTIKELIPEKELQRDLLQSDVQEERAKVLVIQQIAHHEERIKAAQQEFEEVRRRLVELETESKAPGQIEIESYAFAASEPERDRRALLSVMALAGAAVLGLVVGYLRTSLDSRIQEVREVRQITRAPFLGMLPLVSAGELPKELGGTTEHGLVPSREGERAGGGAGDTSVLPALMEGMRMVRTALLERLRAANQRVILVASPTLRAGKTSVALLLSRSLAVIGKRVLLVEGDFYRPCLAERLGLEPKAGLAALLAGGSPLLGGIRPTGVTNLDVLFAGEVPEDFSPETLANGVFADCLTRWKESYDYIILDSPPVLPVADARILASHADGTLMVVRASHTRRAEVEDAYRQLSSSRGEVLGVVLIGEQDKRHGYGYGYGYGYRPGAGQGGGGSGSGSKEGGLQAKSSERGDGRA